MVYPRPVPSEPWTASCAPSSQQPPFWAEWWYFAQVFYAVLGSFLGLSVDFVGFAGLALLAAVNLLRLGRWMRGPLLALLLPYAFVGTYISIQIFVFGESPMSDLLRVHIAWIVGLSAVQCLALRRGFLDRAALVFALIGAVALPFMDTSFRGSGRLGLERGVGFANPNDLSAWFGFCALYCAMLALASRRALIRVVTACCAVGCVLVMALTVSRGPLVALAVALLVGMRPFLRRGIFALVPLVLAASVLYGTGAFDHSAEMYAERGMSDSGRFLVWPLAIRRFLDNPVFGVGVAHVGTLVNQDFEITPHNEFIFIVLSSGVFPLLFFLWYWVELARSAARMRRHRCEDAALAVPMLVYVVLIGLQLNEPYMTPWSMVVFGVVSMQGVALKARESASRLATPRVPTMRLGRERRLVPFRP
jgi:hypothetical protein